MASKYDPRLALSGRKPFCFPIPNNPVPDPRHVFVFPILPFHFPTLRELPDPVTYRGQDPPQSDPEEKSTRLFQPLLHDGGTKLELGPRSNQTPRHGSFEKRRQSGK